MRRLFDLETIPGLLALGALIGVLLFPLLWATRLGIAALRERNVPTGATAVATADVLPITVAPESTPDTAAPTPAAPPDAPLPTLVVPVQGLRSGSLPSTFGERRGRRLHEGLDLRAARGTPVLAAHTGRIIRLSRSSRGGLEVRQLDESGRLCFYYAHLLRYARGLREGQPVTSGAVIAYVGSSGNAPERAPHLHFGVFRAEGTGRCGDEALDPLPLLTR